MKIDILTLFPEMFKGPFEESIVKRAQDKKLIEIKIHNLRDWAKDKHKMVDDKPYGGEAGMVLRVDVVDAAISDLKSSAINHQPLIILLSPQGKKFSQQKAKDLSSLDHLILIAGHYEGFDERIRKHLIDEEISIGDYVLTGGEIPIMAVVDAVVRLIPEVLGKEESLMNETHSTSTIDHKQSLTRSDNRIQPLTIKKKHPVYTRPESFKGWSVPEVLLSGNHAEIEKWRKEKTEKR